MGNLKLCISAFLMLCIQFSMKAQTSINVEVYPNKTITLSYERLDISKYQGKFAKSGSLDYAYTEPDGTKMRITCQRSGEPIEVYQTPPPPAVHRIFKEFYPDGRLKQKGLYLPLQFRIGKWLECDRSGNCSVVDYEIGRSTFNYNSILKLLTEKGYINRTGTWIQAVWYTPSSKRWGIKVSDNAGYTELTINGNTGEVISENKYKMPSFGTQRGY